MKANILILLLAFMVSTRAYAQTGISVSPVTVTNSCVTLTQYLHIGSRDVSTRGEVTVLQQYLDSAGYMNYPPTGYFGALTFAGVQGFQRANGISPIGIVGPLTRAKIQALSCGGIIVTPPVSALSIASMTPTTGQIGTTVTLSGTGFTPNDVIKFGIGAINNIQFINQHSISFAIPDYMGVYCAPGTMCPMIAMQVREETYPVAVTDGTTASNAINFTIVADSTNHTPTISLLSPTSGQIGTLVTVYGTGFDPNTSVTVDGTVSVSVQPTIQNSHQLTFTIPSTTNYECFAYPCNQQSLTPGTYHITIKNSYGMSDASDFTITK